MKITTEQSEATVRRIVRITEDRPVVKPDGYRRSFAVDVITIDYTWKDGTFQITDAFSVHLSGHWMKKDGGYAKDRATGMRPERVRFDSLEWAPQYAFLAPVIDLLRPSGDLSMMILNDAEVNG